MRLRASARDGKGRQMSKPIKAAAGAVALCASFGLASVAEAQGNPRNCAPRDRVIERLATGYGETRQSIGLGANNAVVEVFASTESGTWTIIVTTTSGLSCMVASGQAFETLAETLPASGKDA